MDEQKSPAVAGPLDGPVGLVDALGLYWQAAYAEGRENRTHDTEDGRAQSALEAIYAAVGAAVDAEREACARLCDVKAKRSRELRASEKRATVARLLAVAEGRSIELALAIRTRQTD